MLARLQKAIWIALFLAFASGFIVAVWSASQFSREPKYDQSKNTSGAADDQEHKEGLAHKSFWEKTADDPVAYFTLWLMAFTGILAVSTIGLWIVTWRSSVKQSRDMQASIAVAKKSADAAQVSTRIAEEALVAGNRAFIIVSFSKPL